MLLALLAGCTDLDGLSSGDGDSGVADGASTTSPAPPAAGDAGADGGRIPGGDFEGNLAACGANFELIGASAVQATPARSGATACKVCNTSGRAGYYGMRVNPEPQASAGGWTLEAWFRSVDSVLAPSQVQLSLEYGGVDGGTLTITPTAQPTPTYQPLQVVKRLGAAAGTQFEIRIGASGNTSSCFLVDDVSLDVVP